MCEVLQVIDREGSGLTNAWRRLKRTQEALLGPVARFGNLAYPHHPRYLSFLRAALAIVDQTSIVPPPP